jgi:hypothetical protein
VPFSQVEKGRPSSQSETSYWASVQAIGGAGIMKLTTARNGAGLSTCAREDREREKRKKLFILEPGRPPPRCSRRAPPHLPHGVKGQIALTHSRIL